jgi:hypothetical protein
MIEHDFRFLPLGSFITLNDHANQIFIIVARALQKSDQKFCVRYRVAQYPDGDKPGMQLPIVADEQVVEIIQQGYTSDADTLFLQDKIRQVEHYRQPEPREEIPEPDFTIPVHTSGNISKAGTVNGTSNTQTSQAAHDDMERLRKNPFYKFEKER